MFVKWWPDILTVRWWKWCLTRYDGKGKYGWTGMSRERLRLYYVRRIKFRVLRLPICWILGHKEYETSDWTWHGKCCSRCHRITEKHIHPRTIVNKQE